MSRANLTGPQVVRNAPRQAPNVNPFASIFNDSVSYARSVGGPIEQFSWIVRQHKDKQLQGRVLGTFHGIQSRLANIQAELMELSQVNCHHLHAIFENPRRDVLERLLQLVEEIHTSANTLYRIVEEDLKDSNGHELTNASQERSNGLAHRIKQALRSCNLTPHENPYLCLSARQLLEGEDNGIVDYIETKDLEQGEKAILIQRRGHFQFWRCQNCKYKVKIYTRESRNATIERTEQTMRLEEASVRYRAVLLAKSHLQNSARQLLKYGCILCLGKGRQLESQQTGFKTEKGLIKHIGNHHNVKELPKVFMDKLHLSSTAAQQDGRRCDLRWLTE